MPFGRGVPLRDESTGSLVVGLAWVIGVGGLMVFLLLYWPIREGLTGVGAWLLTGTAGWSRVAG